MLSKFRRGLTPYAHARGADAYGMANAATIDTTKSEKAGTLSTGIDCCATFWLPIYVIYNFILCAVFLITDFWEFQYIVSTLELGQSSPIVCLILKTILLWGPYKVCNPRNIQYRPTTSKQVHHLNLTIITPCMLDNQYTLYYLNKPNSDMTKMYI